MAFDLPPAMQERVVCSISAAAEYGVPANIMLAVAERENGRPGLARRNSNATYDLGSMQLNTRYIASLQRYGITAADAMAPGCYPYKLAAWRIRGHLLRDKGDLWTRAANYHSYTPVYNAAYRRVLLISGAKWTSWLARNYNVAPEAGAEAPAPSPATVTPASFHPKAAPVVVTSGFGWRWHPVTGGWKAHAGVDLAARQGTPVVAASGGVVSYAGWMRGYGLLIEVDRGDGLATRYGHLSRVVVSRGQSVLQGQEIGAVGATGIATGPHLHYEVRVNGQPVDPSPLLQGASLNGVRTSANTSIRHEKNSRGRLVMSDASTGYVERNIAPRMP